MTALQGFSPAPFDFCFEDVWPLAVIRTCAMRAYKLLERREQIVIRYPLLVHWDRLQIAYASQLPRDWTLSLLKEAEDSLVAEVKTERERLEREIERMVDAGMTEEDLETFGDLVRRHQATYAG